MAKKPVMGLRGKGGWVPLRSTQLAGDLLRDLWESGGQVTKTSRQSKGAFKKRNDNGNLHLDTKKGVNSGREWVRKFIIAHKTAPRGAHNAQLRGIEDDTNVWRCHVWGPSEAKILVGAFVGPVVAQQTGTPPFLRGRATRRDKIKKDMT